MGTSLLWTKPQVGQSLLATRTTITNEHNDDNNNHNDDNSNNKS